MEIRSIDPCASHKKCDGVLCAEFALASQASHGDRDAFGSLFAFHRRNVYSLCLRMLRNVPDAEDLTQDIFIEALQNIITFRQNSSFSTWLYRVSMNTILMKQRRDRLRLHPSLDDLAFVTSNAALRAMGRNDLRLIDTPKRIALLSSFRELSFSRQRVLVLHDIWGYNHREISARLHCSAGNSKSQLHKARLQMRKLL
jgi:RNA polymerase sigma-70 factor (ECF subfamily)